MSTIRLTILVESATVSDRLLTPVPKWLESGRQDMSKCAFFVSAPTVRFLKVMRELGTFPSAQRRRIAADVYTRIKPLVGNRHIDQLRHAARGVQDERWRLISGGSGEMCDVGFASVALTEQWLRAQIELDHTGSPIREALAEKRSEAIENFIRDNLTFEAGEIIHLHALASLQPGDGDNAAMSAA
jgi:hypothetical protein